MCAHVSTALSPLSANSLSSQALSGVGAHVVGAAGEPRRAPRGLLTFVFLECCGRRAGRGRPRPQGRAAGAARRMEHNSLVLAIRERDTPTHYTRATPTVELTIP